MPFELIVYHDEVFKSAEDSFAVLMPTSLVDATCQEAMVVEEMSAAEVGGKRLRRPIADSNSRVSHGDLASYIIVCIVPDVG